MAERTNNHRSTQHSRRPRRGTSGHREPSPCSKGRCKPPAHKQSAARTYCDLLGLTEVALAERADAIRITFDAVGTGSKQGLSRHTSRIGNCPCSHSEQLEVLHTPSRCSREQRRRGAASPDLSLRLVAAIRTKQILRCGPCGRSWRVRVYH